MFGQELLKSWFLLCELFSVPFLAEFDGEHNVISNFLSNGLLDCIFRQFGKLILDDVIFLKLVPIFFSQIKDDAVTKVQNGCVFGPKLSVHNSLIDDELLLELAGVSVVIELESLHELLLMICVSLKSLDDGHTSLICLDDIHGQVLNVILVVLSDQIRPDGDLLLVVFVVLAVVVIS